MKLIAVPFNWQSYQKQQRSRTSDQSHFRLQNKFRKMHLSVMLPHQVWWYSIKWFLSYSKSYICKFMQANSWHHKLFHFHLFFWIWKVWKGKKLQKCEHLENKKSFLDEIKKKIFIVFEGLSDIQALNTFLVGMICIFLMIFNFSQTIKV